MATKDGYCLSGSPLADVFPGGTTTRNIIMTEGDCPDGDPTASFTYSCNDVSLTCQFTDTSSDDGTVDAWDWNFGDTNTSSTQNPQHTYGAPGTYSVELMVTDNDGNTDSTSQSVSVGVVPSGDVHVGDLDAVGDTEKNNWWTTVTITVHDGSEGAEAGATVNVTWSGGASGSDSCVTNGSGQCSVISPNMHKKTGSVTLTVDGVVPSAGSYDSSANHDTDGDSTGTVITALKP
jgi:PKD repeat protein